MKKRISIMLAVVLVLVTIMAVCLVGCGPKMDKEMKKAFKGVDMKDAKAILGVIDKAIDDGNVTVTSKAKETYGEETATMTVIEKLDGKKISMDRENNFGDETDKRSTVGELKDGKFTSYLLRDGKWVKDGESPNITEEILKEEIRSMVNTKELKELEFKYDSKEKNFTGTLKYPNSDLKFDVVMTVIDNGIELKVSGDMEGAKYISTIVVSNIGSTKVTVPDVA